MLIVEGRERRGGGLGPNKTYERERREEDAFKNQIHRHSVRENQFINTVLDGSKMVHLFDFFLSFFCKHLGLWTLSDLGQLKKKKKKSVRTSNPILKDVIDFSF